MKKVEIAFLVAVYGFASLFSGLALTSAKRALVGRGAALAGPAGVGGKARNLDLEKMKRLIRQQYLSDHEAEFYRPVETLPAPPQASPPKEEPSRLSGNDKPE
jgi:hypothetical protein